MHAFSIPESHTASGSWTEQVRLLSRLYNATIHEIRLISDRREVNDIDGVNQSMLRTQRLLLEIVGGLDLSFGEIPENVGRLCHFCLQCLEDPTDENLFTAEKIMTVLAEGFHQIIDEVERLESTRQLPSREAEQGIVDQFV